MYAVYNTCQVLLQVFRLTCLKCCMFFMERTPTFWCGVGTDPEEFMYPVLHLIESSRWRWPRVRAEKRKPTMRAPCVLLSAMFTILLRTVARIDVDCAWRCRKRSPCMETMPLHFCMDAKAKCYKQASRHVTEIEAAEKLSLWDRQKFHFPKSATAKLILMTMIGTLISSPSELLPISIF